jgi:hypothetical protein
MITSLVITLSGFHCIKKVFPLLGFHGCVGGCKGCLNLNQATNLRLKETVKLMEEFYLENNLDQTGISRADLWSMAAIIAVKIGFENQDKYL